MSGTKGVRAVWPATLVCGVSFGVTQFLVSNFIGPYLTDILASIAAILSLVLLLRVW
jgi:L-lactate permease